MQVAPHAGPIAPYSGDALSKSGQLASRKCQILDGPFTLGEKIFLATMVVWVFTGTAVQKHCDETRICTALVREGAAFMKMVSIVLLLVIAGIRFYQFVKERHNYQKVNDKVWV